MYAGFHYKLSWEKKNSWDNTGAEVLIQVMASVRCNGDIVPFLLARCVNKFLLWFYVLYRGDFMYYYFWWFYMLYSWGGQRSGVGWSSLLCQRLVMGTLWLVVPNNNYWEDWGIWGHVGFSFHLKRPFWWGDWWGAQEPHERRKLNGALRWGAHYHRWTGRP